MDNVPADFGVKVTEHEEDRAVPGCAAQAPGGRYGLVTAKVTVPPVTAK